MKLLMRIKLRAQKHWVITCLLIVILVFSLDRLVLYLMTSSKDFDTGAYSGISKGMWIVDAIIIGLLSRVVFGKSKEPEDH